jgi:hypothetical protein
MSKLSMILLVRDKLLLESAWTQLSDAPLTDADKALWQTYRETLQGLEFAYTDPNLVVFPDPPTVTSTPQTPAIIAAKARRLQSRITAKAIPNWATWTQAEWQTFFDANLSTTQVAAVSTTAQIRVMMNKQNLVIQNLVKLVIAMRDQTWPDL